MTTPAMNALYQAVHKSKFGGKPYAVFNPHNKPVGELPTIYGFNNGGSPGWYSAVLLADDGTPLGGHVCSHECYMEHDLGIVEGTRPDRHETFRAHYPDGYQMNFVGEDEVMTHPGLSAAVKNNQAKAPPDGDPSPTTGSTQDER